MGNRSLRHNPALRAPLFALSPATPLIALLSLAALPARASSVYDLSGQTILAPAGQSGENRPGDSQYMVDPSLIKVDRNAIDMNGREYKAGEAYRLSIQGRDAATTAGINYMTAAIPKLASPIAAIRAEGRRLMRKARTEFRQAAADQGVADKNKAQKDLLTAEAGQSGEQRATEGASTQKVDAAVQSLLKDPQAAALFTERGINAENFLGQLVSGAFHDDADMFRALGDDGTAETDAGSEASVATTNAAAPAESAREENGSASGKRLGMEDGAKAEASAAAGLSGGGPGGPATAGSATGFGTTALASASEGVAASGPVDGARAPSTSGASARDEDIPEKLKGFVEQLLREAGVSRAAGRSGLGGDADLVDTSRLAVRASRPADDIRRRTLERQGIVQLNHRTSLFHLARAHFKTYRTRVPRGAGHEPAAAEPAGPEDRTPQLLTRAKALRDIKQTPWALRWLAYLGLGDDNGAR